MEDDGMSHWITIFIAKSHYCIFLLNKKLLECDEWGVLCLSRCIRCELEAWKPDQHDIFKIKLIRNCLVKTRLNKNLSNRNLAASSAISLAFEPFFIRLYIKSENFILMLHAPLFNFPLHIFPNQARTYILYAVIAAAKKKYFMCVWNSKIIKHK